MPAGSSAVAPTGTIACLRLAALSASGSNRIRRAKPAMIAAIFASISSSRTMLDAGEARDDLGRQVVGGRPEPAAGDDQVDSRRRP